MPGKRLLYEIELWPNLSELARDLRLQVEILLLPLRRRFEIRHVATDGEVIVDSFIAVVDVERLGIAADAALRYVGLVLGAHGMICGVVNATRTTRHLNCA